MSKMSELQIAIMEMLEDGYLYTEIAQKLEIPIDWVEDVVDDWYETEGYYYYADEVK